MTARPPSDAGFTLIEMLVALVLFSAIGLAGFTVLDTVLTTRARTEGRMERLAEIERALILVSRDLAQKRPGALTGDEDGIVFLGAGAAGPAVVDWSLEDGALLRRIMLADGSGPGVEQGVLDGVAGVQWRFLDAERVWHDAWPPEGERAELRAVRVEIAPLGVGPGTGATASRLIELPRQPAT